VDAWKRQIGEEIEPGNRPKAPGRLELLQRFINTHNHEFPDDWDRLGTAAKATAWLRAHALLGVGERVSAADAAALRAVRETLRGLLTGAPAEPLRARVTITLDPRGHTVLEPAAGGADGAVATLLGILHEAQLSGEWGRMKGCRQCEYAFYDRSKNRSAAWCSMAICGNRTKNRTYYRKRRG